MALLDYVFVSYVLGTLLLATTYSIRTHPNVNLISIRVAGRRVVILHVRSMV